MAETNSTPLPSFYIYQHVRLDKDEVFYVGKGTVKRPGKYPRAFSAQKRNPRWFAITHGVDYRVDIVATFATEEACYNEERRLIAYYGREISGDGTLCNMTEGGEGTSGHRPSPETQAKKSQSRKSNTAANEAVRMAFQQRGQAKYGGRIFERLTVLTYLTHAGASPTAICECECGHVGEYLICHLVRGHTCSCGCISTPHGLNHSPEHQAWVGMRARCRDSSDQFKDYAGRGITVCARWMKSFLPFLSDMGNKPSPQHEIGRINKNKGYWCGKAECSDCGPSNEPPNCQWITPKEQARNTRRNVIVTYQGQSYVLLVLAEILHIDYGLLRHRVKAKWPEERWTEPAQRGALPTISVTYQGQRYSRRELAVHLSLPLPVLESRLRHKWPEKRLAERPTHNRYHRSTRP